MGFRFLSDDWFDKVEELTVAAGDLGLSEAAKALIMNIRIEGDEGDCDICIGGGVITKGLNDAAPITISVPFDIARKMFVDQDQNATAASIQDLLSGKSRDILPVVAAAAKADMSFKLLIGVRNKLIEAYKQTMNMQI